MEEGTTDNEVDAVLELVASQARRNKVKALWPPSGKFKCSSLDRRMLAYLRMQCRECGLRYDLEVAFIDLSTQRIIQPSSRPVSDFVVKSVVQSSKHRCTRLEYVWVDSVSIFRLSIEHRVVQLIAGRRKELWDETYGHKLLHLFGLDSCLELPLFAGGKSAAVSRVPVHHILLDSASGRSYETEVLKLIRTLRSCLSVVAGRPVERPIRDLFRKLDRNEIVQVESLGGKLLRHGYTGSWREVREIFEDDTLGEVNLLYDPCTQDFNGEDLPFLDDDLVSVKRKSQLRRLRSRYGTSNPGLIFTIPEDWISRASAPPAASFITQKRQSSNNTDACILHPVRRVLGHGLPAPIPSTKWHAEVCKDIVANIRWHLNKRVHWVQSDTGWQRVTEAPPTEFYEYIQGALSYFKGS